MAGLTTRKRHGKKDGNPGSGNLPGSPSNKKIYHKMIISSERRKMQEVERKNILALEAEVEMVDKELRVLSIKVTDIPEWIKEQFAQDTPNEDINQLTFFYYSGADAVVLNRDHRDFDFYKLLVVAYLEASEKRQKELKEKVPTEIILPRARAVLCV